MTSRGGSKSVMLPGAHRQEKARASGWTIYWYAWRGGPQIALFNAPTLEAAREAEIAGAAEIAANYAMERRPKPATGTIARLIADFMSPENTDWATLAPATQAAWGRWLEIAKEKWGALSGEEFASDAAAHEVRLWRNELAKKSPSNADKAMEAISRLCTYGRHRSVKLLPHDCNPTQGLEKAYVRPAQMPPRRADVIAALAALPPCAAAICDIALNSGLRRSDLVRLSDTHIDEAAGVIRIDPRKSRKQGRVAVLRLTPPLLAAIKRSQALRDELYARKLARARRRGESEPARPLTVIVNTRCRAFTANGLYQHIRDAFEAADKTRINPHGFRRAAATQRFLSGLSWAQIGRELGWAEAEAEKMGAIYVHAEAIAKP